MLPLLTLLALDPVISPPALPCTDCSLQEATTLAGLAWPPPHVRIEIDKSERSLLLFSGEAPLKRYRVGLGEPAGDKVQQGDRRTPNGRFQVVTRNAQSQFHLFLGLSYPDAEDARRGLASGLISEREARAIEDADRAGRQPSWNTRLGGAIGIHGGGGESDWTLGCIAVSNAEIEEIWAVTRMGTVVEVRE